MLPVKFYSVLLSNPVADPRGAPPTAKNFLNFMQFFGKFGKIICWRPHPRGLVPLLQGILDPPLINLLISLKT